MGLCVDIQVLYYDDGETKKRNLVFCAVETISYPVQRNTRSTFKIIKVDCINPSTLNCRLCASHLLRWNRRYLSTTAPGRKVQLMQVRSCQ